MKYRKPYTKILAFLLAAVMLFGYIGIPSYAEDTPKQTAALADIKVSNASTFKFSEIESIMTAILEKRNISITAIKQDPSDVVNYTVYKTNARTTTTLSKLICQNSTTSDAINVEFEEPDYKDFPKKEDDPTYKKLISDPSWQAKMIVIKVSSADGTKLEKEYKIKLGRNNPLISPAPLETLEINNIVPSTYSYLQTVFTYNGIETGNGNPITITPSFKDASDKVTYSITGDAEKQDVSVSDDQEISIGGLQPDESKEIKFHIKTGNDFRYTNSDYILKITRQKQPASIQKIDLTGIKGQYLFDPATRSYAIKTGSEVAFSVVPDGYQQKADSITYQISGSGTATPAPGGTFSVTIPKGTNQTVTVTAVPNAQDPGRKEGSYSFQLNNTSLTKEEELEKLDAILAPIVEGSIADGSWWNTARYGSPWSAASLNTLGWHRDKELYRSNPDFYTYLFKPDDSRPYANWPREAMGLLATGFTLDELQSIKLGTSETHFDYKQEILNSSGQSFVDMYVGANPEVYTLIKDKLKNYAKTAIGSNTAGPHQLADGSYFDSHLGGVDGTAMSIAALSIFYEKPGFEDVTASINKAIAYLARQQERKTGYYYYGKVANTESLAQVIVALCSIGIDPNTDSRFLSDSGRGLVDILTEDWVNKDGFFVHTWELNGRPNGMATEQGLRALAAYRGFVANGKTASFNIYDTTQVTKKQVQLPAKLKNISVTGSRYDFDPYTRWEELSVSNTSSLTIPVIRNDSNDEVHYSLKNGASGTVAFSGDTGKVQLNGLSEGTYTLTLNVVPGDKSNWENGRYILDITVLPKGSQPEAEKKEVTFTLSTSQAKNWNWSFTEKAEIGKKDTVWSVMQPLMKKHGYTCNISSNSGYIASITKDGKTLSEFTEGKNSGWMYTVNGEFPNVAVTEYPVDSGDVIVFFYTVDYAKERYKMDPDKPVIQNNSVIATLTLQGQLDASGRAIASVTAKDMSSTLAKALEAAKAGKKNIIPTVRLDVSADSKATGVETAIPAASVKEAVKENAALTMATPIGTVAFDQKALSNISDNAGSGDVKISVDKMDKAKVDLSKVLTANIGTVFELKITSGDKSITDFKDGKVNVTLPYTLAKNEKAGDVCVYYVDTKGNPELMKGSSYDAKTGMVTFETTHFSYYAIGSVLSDKFEDVKNGQWFYENIMYLVNKGVAKGKTDTRFAPNDKITRAEFVQILYGIAQSQTTTGSVLTTGSAVSTGSAVTGGATAEADQKLFYDVNASAWYGKAVAWAHEKGIVSGIKSGDTLNFVPDANISRQDMAVMIKNYTDKVERKSVSSVIKPTAFADGQEISPYAKDAVAEMQKGGIINGLVKQDTSGADKTVFAPKNNATRAEAAAMIAKLLQSRW